jgi:hypothetical protein
MSDDETLLRHYQPRLIALAQDTALHRPWNGWFERVVAARGDYHPCRADFFLSFVVQRDRPRSFWAGVLGDPGHPPPTGLTVLQALTARTTPEGTLDWEIDLSPIESQDGVQAWQAYGPMLGQEKPFQPTIYGHCVRDSKGIGLEYWFLAMYNDAPNKHEGDWEMAAIELNQMEVPQQAGYASHRSGLRRLWPAVERDGDRPLVYVARGSHASYFGHRKEGHRTNSFVVPHKGLSPVVESILALGVTFLQKVIVFLRLHDHTPTHPLRPDDEPLNRGEFVDAELEVLPEPESVAPDSPFWWMRLRCAWGSRHTRLFGDIAPDPPWEQGDKWSNPLAWIAGLDLDS